VQFEEVVALHNGGKYKEAEKLYNLLLEKRPDDPTLLYCLGTLYTQMEREAVGVVLLRAAIRQLPKHASAWANLAYGLKKIGHRREAALAHQKAIELDPTNSDWYSNFAADYIGNGDPEPAIPLLAKAIELNPNNPHAHWHMGLALLELGDFENGWPQYDWGFLANQRLVRNYEVDWWNGDRDQTVVVYTEQGMGDEIMFASMLPDLIAVSKSVILDCNPRLEQLFRQSFPEITVYGTRKDETISWPRNHQIDAKIAIASLGRYFRRSKDSFPGTPYLKADPMELGEGMWVGISWEGGSRKNNRLERSMRLDDMEPLLRTPGINWVSLQYTKCEKEIEEFTQRTGIKIHHWREIIDDYAKTASLVKSLDLTISVAQSVIHLCGALGAPCWCLVPNTPNWCFGLEGDMPWYKSVSLYRRQGGSWTSTIEKVTNDLEGLCRVRPEAGCIEHGADPVPHQLIEQAVGDHPVGDPDASDQANGADPVHIQPVPRSASM